MKQFKVIGLLAILLIGSVLLASCGTKVSTWDVLNEDYRYESNLCKTAEEIGELSGFSLTDQGFGFCVYAKEEGDTLIQKVFSMQNRRVVCTVAADSEAVTYSIQLLVNLPMFCVSKTELLEGKETITYTYFDATGAELLSLDSKEVVSSPRNFHDLVILDHVAYTKDADTGALTKKFELPIHAEFYNINFSNKDYYYRFDDGLLSIFTKKFEPLTSWAIPSYVDEDNVMVHVLNQGNVLIQYLYVLDEDAKKYDISMDLDEDGGLDKVALVSLLLTPEGEEKKLKLDYIVHQVETQEELYDSDLAPEENRVTGDFENIATISKIVNRMLDVSIDRRDYVLMDNEGKNLGSIRLLDGQATALPLKVKENLYVLETTQGIAYLNGEGTVLHTVMDGTLTRFGEILLGSRGIYDLELNEIYNFRANHASVLGKVDDTVFVWQENGEAHDVLSFRGGKQTTVCGAADGSSFKLLPSMKLYVISNAENTEHRYYSIDGTHLLTTDVALSFVCAGGGAYMMWNANEEAPVYYCFS